MISAWDNGLDSNSATPQWALRSYGVGTGAFQFIPASRPVLHPPGCRLGGFQAFGAGTGKCRGPATVGRHKASRGRLRLTPPGAGSLQGSSGCGRFQLPKCGGVLRSWGVGLGKLAKPGNHNPSPWPAKTIRVPCGKELGFTGGEHPALLGTNGLSAGAVSPP